MASLSVADQWNLIPYDTADHSSTVFPEGSGWAGHRRASALLLEAFNSHDWAPHRWEFDRAFHAPSFAEFLDEIGRGSADSSAGITGIGYGHLGAFPRRLQRLFHKLVQVVVVHGVVPDGLVDLIIVALPKGSAQVGGV